MNDTPNNVISLVPKIEEAKIEAAKPIVHEDIVSNLERLLASAKEGKIVALACATVNTDDTCTSNFAGGSSFVTLIGSVQVLSQRLVHAALIN